MVEAAGHNEYSKIMCWASYPHLPDAIVICYDVNNKLTFDWVEDLLLYLLEYRNMGFYNCTYYIVGNKIDQDEYKRAIQKSDAEEWLEEMKVEYGIDIKLYEVSA